VSKELLQKKKKKPLLSRAYLTMQIAADCFAFLLQREITPRAASTICINDFDSDARDAGFASAFEKNLMIIIEFAEATSGVADAAAAADEKIKNRIAMIPILPAQYSAAL
jgi:hypothetical protein